MTDAAACQRSAALPPCVSTHPATRGLGSFPLSGSRDAHCRGCVYTGACVDTFSILFSFLATPALVLKHGSKGQYRHTRSRVRNVSHGAQGSTPRAAQKSHWQSQESPALPRGGSSLRAGRSVVPRAPVTHQQWHRLNLPGWRAQRPCPSGCTLLPCHPRPLVGPAQAPGEGATLRALSASV